jgi:peptidoglycan lytic transglycosylase
MSMRVRRLGVVGLVVLAAASLLRTSISFAFARSDERANLNFSLSTSALASDLPTRAASLEIATEPRVPRSRRVVLTEVETLGFRTLIQYSRDVPVGMTRVVTEGTVGQALRTVRVVFRGGTVISRRLLSYVLLSSPLPRVELRGSRAAGADAATHSQLGQASWYECSGMYAAHLSLPFGTVVTVTNLDNGGTVTVVINDRGPYGIADRIIDLCSSAFAQLAPLAQGVARVKITW